MKTLRFHFRVGLVAVIHILNFEYNKPFWTLVVSILRSIVSFLCGISPFIQVFLGHIMSHNSSQHPNGDLQPPIAPVLIDLAPTFGFHGDVAYTWHTYLYTDKIFIHIKQDDV